MSQLEENSPSPEGIDIGGLVHAVTGIVALVAGGLMYSYDWALLTFSLLMILSAISAVLISWEKDAWVPGHWLAMLPVIGVVAGFLGVQYAFTFAYICLWIAFGHFVIRGIQGMRAAD
jgi:hypothetical protein